VFDVLDSPWVSLRGSFEALKKVIIIIGKLSLGSKRKKWKNSLGKHIQTITGDVSKQQTSNKYICSHQVVAKVNILFADLCS